MYTRRRLLAVGALGAVASCRRSGQMTIGVIPKATSHLFFLSVHAGVEQAARDFHLDILWNGPQNETDYARQIEIVDSMITRQVAALAISATDDRALVAPIERAIRAGIPVTIFDSAVDIDNYVSFIATDNHSAGCTAARTLASLLGNHGAVAMVMQKPGGTSTVLRERGFDETMAKEFPRIQVVARQFGMADPARSRAAAEDILTAHPDLAGLFASSEAASLGSIQAIRNRGLAGKLKLVTFDFSKTHVEALEDGTINAMLVQNPFQLGYEAVKSLHDKLNGRTPLKRLELPARVILKSDLTKPDVRALLSPDWLKNQ
ncbi:MAG TPA: substrate-binding domain-containing protein [Bryobacteraceae bacterium]|jgi:ribose transport system substrate-binding protein|nr:substrate-binding domain-containing protein [Bryobacteraceae bacterium]